MREEQNQHRESTHFCETVEKGFREPGWEGVEGEEGRVCGVRSGERVVRCICETERASGSSDECA